MSEVRKWRALPHNTNEPGYPYEWGKEMARSAHNTNEPGYLYEWGKEMARSAT